MTTTNTYIEKAIKRLVVGDKVISATGRELKVTSITPKENRTIILFDGDMEVDFDPYMQVKVVNNIK
jgi:preprotein translocase subunit YajC